MPVRGEPFLLMGGPEGNGSGDHFVGLELRRDERIGLFAQGIDWKAS